MKNSISQFEIAALIAAAVVTCSAADDSVRNNPTVELIRHVKSCVVPIFAFGTNDESSSGAGAVIHPGGFILTADHVTRNQQGVALFGMKREAYEVVGRLPEKDLAILKVGAPKPRDFVPLGRSSDVCEGETIVAIGNPGGRGIVYSQGIVSCASMDPTWPSVLSQTYWREESDSPRGRDDYIQFDAASNRGNSGGPLINAAGQIIGVVARKQDGEEAINWAIPVDRVLRFFNYMVQPEEADGFWTGAQLNLLATNAVVTNVAADSPGAKAGVAAGDVVVSVDGAAIRTGPDWLLSLWGRKTGDTLAIEFRHGDELRRASLKLESYPMPAAISKKGKTGGLRYSVYRRAAGVQLQRMPEFSGQKPVQEGTIPKLSPDEFVQGSKDNYAVVFRGYVDFPREGHYRLILDSDDGSKCYLNDQLIIDNDFTHPPQPLSRSVRVPAGLTPVRIEYFQSRGGRALTLQVMAMEKTGQPVTDAVFYRD